MAANFCERLFTAHLHHPASAARSLRHFQRLAGRRWASLRSSDSAPGAPSSGVRSRLQYLASLDVTTPPSAVRRTGIVCTIGPACDSVEALAALMTAGMTVARLNMSHGSFAEHAERVRRLRRAGALLPDSPPLAVAVDTKGPELRTGVLQDGAGSVELVTGARLRLTSDPHHQHRSSNQLLYVDHAGLADCVGPGDRIHLDDGRITLRVTAIDGDSVECTVESGSRLGSQKSICVPGVSLPLPAVTERDREDLRQAAQLPVDLVFASFVRDSDGVRQLRAALGEEGRHIKIISKIESLEGLLNIDSIIAESDGVMVARGDMGVELPPEKVFIAQKSIIAKCNMAGRPVICATEMMESMIRQPRPTRAELADVANAVLDGADCVMLSGETANGAFPQEAVRLMDRTCRQAEAVLDFDAAFGDLRSQVCIGADAKLDSAADVVRTASAAGVAAILVLSEVGGAARRLARFRPPCPVLMVTSSEQVARQSRLHSGIVPIVLPEVSATSRLQMSDDVIQWAIMRARQLGVVSAGDSVALADTHDGHLKTRLIRV